MEDVTALFLLMVIKKILIPKISYRGEDVQVTLRLESGETFKAVEISDSECD